MSQQAHHLKPGTYLYVNNAVYQLISAHEVRSGHSVHCLVENFMTGHRTKMNFGLHHHVRVVEPEQFHYTVTGLQDQQGDRLFLSMLTAGDEPQPREDYAESDPVVQEYLTKYFENSENDPLEVILTRIHIEKLHRVDKEVTLERLTKVPGLDQKHRHDHHHHHHHH